MKSFISYMPTKVIFGKGRTDEVGRICAFFGFKKILVVYGGKSAKESGLADRVEKALKAEGIEFATVSGVTANPRLSKANEIAQAGIDFGADFLLAVGGGSVIDAVKSAAYKIADPDTDIWDYYTGAAIPKVAVPHGTVLTIPAAGSEMSNSSVLTDDVLGSRRKLGLLSDLNRCRFAILDPELCATLPKLQIGAGATDIFMHTAERYFMPKEYLGNHMSDEIAEGLMRNIFKYGPIAYNEPDNYEAMSELMWSSSVSHNDMTGLGLEPDTGRGGDWATHAIGQAMSALYDSTHGSSLSAIWGSWARYCCDANRDRFIEYGKKLWNLSGSDEDITEEAIRKTEEWFESMGQPTNINDLLGFRPDDSDIEKLADNLFPKQGMTKGILKKLTREDVVNIYKLARK